MKVLLLSAYDTPSHNYWCLSLQRHITNIDWTYLSLPGRYFSWRIRGNSLTWSVRERERLAQHYDLIIATSMTDLATLRGLCPALAAVPTILYFHENQFAYPQSALAHASVEPKMVTLYAGLAADYLIFNSDYNRRTFLTGVAALLRQLPDEIPAGIVDSLRGKASVLPVPIDLPVTSANGLPSRAAPEQLPLEIVWNHRWEYDKGPRQLLDCVLSLPADCQVRFHVVGQQFRKQPPEFAQIQQVLHQRGWLGQWGTVTERAAYLRLLQSCHCVLSTAEHDFQGLAVLEAVAAGCRPLVPNRLAYPEWFGSEHCYGEESVPELSLQDTIVKLHDQLAGDGMPAAPDVSFLSWDALLPRYRTLLFGAGRTQPVPILK